MTDKVDTHLPNNVADACDVDFFSGWKWAFTKCGILLTARITSVKVSLFRINSVIHLLLIPAAMSAESFPNNRDCAATTDS